MNLACSSIDDTKGSYSTTEVAEKNEDITWQPEAPKTFYSPWKHLTSSYHVQSVRQSAKGVKTNLETTLALAVAHHPGENADPWT